MSVRLGTAGHSRDVEEENQVRDRALGRRASSRARPRIPTEAARPGKSPDSSTPKEPPTRPPTPRPTLASFAPKPPPTRSSHPPRKSASFVAEPRDFHPLGMRRSVAARAPLSAPNRNAATFSNKRRRPPRDASGLPADWLRSRGKRPLAAPRPPTADGPEIGFVRRETSRLSSPRAPCRGGGPAAPGRPKFAATPVSSTL